MRVCKHGCGVKMFCFSPSNHASTNLKTFSSSKLEKFTFQAYFFFREKEWAEREFHDDWGWVIVCFVKNLTYYNSCGRSK